MEPQTYKTIKLPNEEIYAYREAGDPSNNTLLFIHPFCYSSRAWELYFEDLKDTFHLVAVDQRGKGFSSYNTPITSFQDFVDDLKLFCDAIGLKKFIIVGWSSGGMIAMKFAALHPEYVEKMLLFNSMGIKGHITYRLNSLFKPNGERVQSFEELKIHPFVTMGSKIISERNYGGAYDLCSKVIFGGMHTPNKHVRDTFIEDYFMIKGHPELIWAMNTFNISTESNGLAEGTGEVMDIKCPTLIIAGNKDPLVPLIVTEEIKNALGDLAELRVYDDVAHAFCEVKRDEFIKIIREFGSNSTVEKKTHFA